MTNTNRLLCVLVLLVPSFVASWQPSTPTRHHPQQQQRHQSTLFANRRDVLKDIVTTTGGIAATTAAASGVLLLPPTPAAQAATTPIDQIGTMGSQTPLSKTSATSSTTPLGTFIGEETQFTTLPNGVKIKDFKLGTGSSDAVTPTSQRLDLQMSGRLINTNAGITFYNTKNNNPDGFGAVPLTINLSQGMALPGLEAGLVGMKKGGIRRIVVPAGDLSYDKFPGLEPKPMSAADQRALDSVVKNPGRDGTIMFDVKLERFNK